MFLQTVLADDEPLARQKLRQMLSEISGVEVVGEGASAAEVLEVVREISPQLRAIRRTKVCRIST